MTAAEAAEQSDPDRNHHFRRRWGESPPQKRKRPVIGGTITRAKIEIGSSVASSTLPSRLAQRIRDLDRAADVEISHGHIRIGERLARLADALREGRDMNALPPGLNIQDDILWCRSKARIDEAAARAAAMHAYHLLPLLHAARSGVLAFVSIHAADAEFPAKRLEQLTRPVVVLVGDDPWPHGESVGPSGWESARRLRYWRPQAVVIHGRDLIRITTGWQSRWRQVSAGSRLSRPKVPASKNGQHSSIAPTLFGLLRQPTVCIPAR